MVDQARARRLAKRITQIVAEALEHEVKDPRLAMVTITDTRVTGDLREATVFYTVLGETIDAPPDSAGAAAALASATGVLRTLVGAGTGIRHTPSLQFVPDAVPDEARRMEELLARTRESDAAGRAAGRRCQPGGRRGPVPRPAQRPRCRRGVNADLLRKAAARARRRPRRRPCWRTCGPTRTRWAVRWPWGSPCTGGACRSRCRSRTRRRCRRRCAMLDVHQPGGAAGAGPGPPEVLVACDAAERSRLGALADRLTTATHSIMIDHHVSNPGFGGLQLLDPGAEATVVVVRRLLAAMDVPLDADVARCIYAGLVTDTSNFVTAGESAHRLAAELIAAGVQAAAAGAVADVHPPARLAGRAGSDAGAGGAGAGRGRRAGPGAHHRAGRGRRTGSAPRRWTAWSTWCAPRPRPRWPPCSSRSPRRAGSPRCAPTVGSTWPRWPAGSAVAGIPARPDSPGRAPRPSCWTRCGPRCRRRPRRRGDLGSARSIAERAGLRTAAADRSGYRVAADGGGTR